MSTLIIKLNATGDVVRTTSLLNRLDGHVTWLTAKGNAPLLDGLLPTLRCLSWEKREDALDRHYDLVINLEDGEDTASYVSSTSHGRLFGSHLDPESQLTYTPDSSKWFDLSLISKHGRRRADQLKFINRRSYQDLIFDGLGFTFNEEPYLLPPPIKTDLSGDVAIAPVAGPVWPMKAWDHYPALMDRLKADGYTVNVLPRRSSLLEHLGDLSQHRVLVSGDSLPMHLAIGARIRCVSLFNCTSPWEIHDYGIQTKIVSPLLGEFFYQRGLQPQATKAITLEEVYTATISQLHGAI